MSLLAIVLLVGTTVAFLGPWAGISVVVGFLLGFEAAKKPERKQVTTLRDPERWKGAHD